MSANSVLLFCVLSATLQILNACNAQNPKIQWGIEVLQAVSKQKCVHCPMLPLSCNKEYVPLDAACGRTQQLNYELVWRNQNCGRAVFFCLSFADESAAVGVQKNLTEPMIIVKKVERGAPFAEATFDCNDDGQWEVVDESGNLITGIESVNCLSVLNI